MSEVPLPVVAIGGFVKAFVLRILAIPAFGPLRRLLYRVVVSGSSFSQVSTRLDVHRLATGAARWKPISSWNRDAIVAVGTLTSSAKVREFLFRHLLARLNFVSALAVLDQAPRSDYSRATQLDAIRAGYSAVKGEMSDALLQTLIDAHGSEISSWPARQFRAVCDSIRQSGLSVDDKIAALAVINDDTLSRSKRVTWLGASVEINRRAGFEADVSSIVKTIVDSTAIDDAAVDQLRAVWAVARESLSREQTTTFMRRALVAPGVTVRNVPFILRELSDDDVQSVLSRDALFRRLADFPQVLNTRTYTANGELARSIVATASTRWFSRSRWGGRSLFERASADIKNQVVGILCRSDCWSLIPDESAIGAVSDTLLDIQFARGLRHLLADEHALAEAVFESVLREHPDHKLSWLGLQWSSVRARKDLGRIEVLREEIGRGRLSDGRPVTDQISAEETVVTSRMWRGDFRRSPLSKVRPAWEAVAQEFGERFIDFDRALPKSSSHDLLVFPINGVSDEVRDAYLYSDLPRRFRSVTIVCDPRLFDLFQRSFPDITFVPFARRDKPLHVDDQRDDPVRGVPTVLANYLPQSLRELLTASTTLVTTGRNLSTQRLLSGDLELATGGYVVPRGTTPKAAPPLRVGVLWRSHVTSGFRGLMYLNLDDMLPLFDVPGVEFVSLQHRTTDAELELLAAHNVTVTDVDLFNDFEATAELCASLDLVIGISTLPAELAAAVGTPVWLLGFSPENCYLRTLGNQHPRDVLTANSDVIAPPNGDFSGTRQSAIDATMSETVRRLTAVSNNAAREGKTR